MNPKKTVNDREIDDLKGSVQERVPAAALVSIQGRCHFTVHLADGYLGLTGALSQKNIWKKFGFQYLLADFAIFLLGTSQQPPSPSPARRRPGANSMAIGLPDTAVRHHTHKVG